jgi:prepilin-type N-terminal cleavage/methylation domain-containing protein
VNFIKEHIKDKKNRNKGFTLIEIMISMALISIIVYSQIIIISRYMKIHRIEVSESRESFYVDEAFMIIEYEINTAKYVEIKDNKIILKRYEGTSYDYIRTDKDSDIIISYGALYSSSSNNILKSVKSFKVEENDNTAYILIETQKGNLYKRCLALERKKIEAASS